MQEKFYRDGADCGDSSGLRGRFAKLKRRGAISVLSLLAVVVGIFSTTAESSFLAYDDPLMVTANDAVKTGFTADGFRFAFTDTTMNLWHPLTWMSHMLDWQLFGEWAGGHHLTNVLWHLANTVLVFFLVSGIGRRAGFGNGFIPLCVALLFGLHPMHVESVAWVSERKDVLSTFFYLATLLAYLSWAQNKRWTKYALACGLCLLGFLAKPSLMTLPFVLLLIDLFPLGRIEGKGVTATAGNLAKLAFEKLPFFAMTAIFMLVAWRVEAGGSHAGLAEMTTFSERLGITGLAYGSYLLRTIWPVDLAPFYPHPAELSAGMVALCWAIMLGISGAAVALVRRAPYLFFGWFWFVGLLFPASGIITISDNFAADRYSYLAHVGLFVAVSFGFAHLFRRSPASPQSASVEPMSHVRRHWPAVAIPVTGAALVIALGVLCFKQVGIWKNDESLWRHAVAATGDRNYFAHNKLAVTLLESGRRDEGLKHLKTAVTAKPDFAFAQANLGRMLAAEGRHADAIPHLEKAIAVKPRDLQMRRLTVNCLQEIKVKPGQLTPHYQAILQIDPKDAEAHFQIGSHFYASGNPDEALQHFEVSAKLAPGNPGVQSTLGMMLVEREEYKSALFHLQTALDAMNADEGDALVPKIQFQLALCQRAMGRYALSIKHFEAALGAAPRQLEIANELAWLLATCPDPAYRDGKKAVSMSWKLNKLDRDPNPQFLKTLAAAYAESGNFERALEAVDFAIKFLADGTSSEREVLVRHRKSYAAERPIRDSGRQRQAAPLITSTP